MSEKAVLRRLRQVDQLRELCLSLMKAKKLRDEKEAAGRPAIKKGQKQLKEPKPK